MARKIPSVSIVVPLYNKGRYVDRAIRSIFAQTFQDFEVVVVDDGSTDDGAEVVRRWVGDRLRLICQDNAGPGAARNRGIRETSAPYLAFLDGDDEWLPLFIETYLDQIHRHSECDAVVGPTLYGTERRDVSAVWARMGVKEGVWFLHPHSTWQDLAQFVDLVGPCAALCRREAVERYGGYYSRHRCCFSEDKYLWIQIALNHKVFRLTQSLFWYHVENSQLYPPAAYGRAGFVPPAITDPGPLYEHCPSAFLTILQKYLCHVALGTLSQNAHTPEAPRLLEIVQGLPQKKAFAWRYLKALVKVMLYQKVWRPAGR